MLLGTRDVADHQIGLADVFVRPAVPRIDRQRALVVFEGLVHLAQLAMREAELVVQVGGIRKAAKRRVEAAQCRTGVARLARREAGDIVLVLQQRLVVCVVRRCGASTMQRQHARRNTQPPPPRAHQLAAR